MPGWSDLTDELDRWHDAGLIAQFWWRDDDVVAPTPALDRLLQCANGVPIALAAVPADVEEALADRLGREPGVRIFQHGWSHRDNARAHYVGEYPVGRRVDVVLQEFRHGRVKLNGIFGDRAMPVFVPPWHQFDPGYMPLLRAAGITGFSGKGPRDAARIYGLDCVNIHCPPIEWTPVPSFAEDEKYLGQICQHLEGRRLGGFDVDEPTGLLTHHLVQNEDSYRFMARLSEHILAHPAACWLEIDEVFRTPKIRFNLTESVMKSFRSMRRAAEHKGLSAA